MIPTPPALHPRVADVTERIRARSAGTRGDYLARTEAARVSGTVRAGHSCTNLAHGFAASGTGQGSAERKRVAERGDRLGLQRHALGAPAVRALSRS